MTCTPTISTTRKSIDCSRDRTRNLRRTKWHATSKPPSRNNLATNYELSSGICSKFTHDLVMVFKNFVLTLSETPILNKRNPKGNIFKFNRF
ncbi:hypothetical protein TNCV_4174211 [Trichonephila clavipes]|nr:hypothetical protein TNCV_4174211 [Trichonephila clavipes]